MASTPINRRTFLATSAIFAGGIPAASARTSNQTNQNVGPIAIGSGNGVRSVALAVEMMNDGDDPLDAVVSGVNIVENDPDDMSVGYGGLPNERGIVELDSSVMHGPTHKAGAVAALRNIKTPSRVALKVCRHTDHVMIVGEGALEFARMWGFKEENLLTERARKAWLKWKSNLSPNDDWLDEAQTIGGAPVAASATDAAPFTWGTIHCSGLDANGDFGAVTTTSGLSWKIPGRVGDSPIIGAGMFCDNEVGSAGATGRGESAIQSCASFQVVQHMSHGLDPTAACLTTLKWVASHTRRHDLLNAAGEPNFQLTLYALRKDGTYGSASMRAGAHFAVNDGNGARRERSAHLFG